MEWELAVKDSEIDRLSTQLERVRVLASQGHRDHRKAPQVCADILSEFSLTGASNE